MSSAHTKTGAVGVLGLGVASGHQSGEDVNDPIVRSGDSRSRPGPSPIDCSGVVFASSELDEALEDMGLRTALPLEVQHALLCKAMLALGIAASVADDAVYEVSVQGLMKSAPNAGSANDADGLDPASCVDLDDSLGECFAQMVQCAASDIAEELSGLPERVRFETRAAQLADWHRWQRPH